MMRLGLAALALTATTWAAPLSAEEQNLKFHFVTVNLASTGIDVPHTEDHGLNLGKFVGVAMFEDGRIAFKEYVFAGENTADGTKGIGYSTYTFQNGDALNFRFKFEVSGGDYELISGTGAYEGATGTGRFDWVESKWENASEWDGSFTLEVPAN